MEMLLATPEATLEVPTNCGVKTVRRGDLFKLTRSFGRGAGCEVFCAYFTGTFRKERSQLFPTEGQFIREGRTPVSAFWWRFDSSLVVMPQEQCDKENVKQNLYA